MLTWNFKVFCRFFILNIETSKSALRCTIPQLFIEGIVLKASDHIFRIAFKDFLVLLLRVVRTREISPENCTVTSTSKNDTVIKYRI